MAFFLILVTFSLCQKEEEYADPVVTFITPFESATFHVFDTMRVHAFIISHDQLTGVEVTLTDGSLSAVLPSQLISLNFPFDTLFVNASIPIDDIHLESGNYFVQIHAKTSHSEKHKYRQVMITEVPRRLTGLVVISRQNAGSVKATLFDSIMQSHEIQSFPFDYGLSVLSSWDQMLYVGGKNTGRLVGWDLADSMEHFSISGYNSPDLPWLQYLYTAKGTLAYATSGGLINAVSRWHKIIMSINLGTQSYCSSLFFKEEILICNILLKHNHQSYIRTYHYPVGTFWKELQMAFTIKEMYEIDEGEILVFGNMAGGGTIQVYYPESNAFWEPLNEPIPEIKAVAMVDAGNFLIATTGDIKWYQHATRTLTVFRPLAATCINFEVNSKQLAAAKDKTIYFYQFPNAPLLHSLSVSDTVRALHFLYNR